VFVLSRMVCAASASPSTPLAYGISCPFTTCCQPDGVSCTSTNPPDAVSTCVPPVRGRPYAAPAMPGVPEPPPASKRVVQGHGNAQRAQGADRHHPLTNTAPDLPTSGSLNVILVIIVALVAVMAPETDTGNGAGSLNMVHVPLSP